jgi:hypothetical protein
MLRCNRHKSGGLWRIVALLERKNGAPRDTRPALSPRIAGDLVVVESHSVKSPYLSLAMSALQNHVVGMTSQE